MSVVLILGALAVVALSVLLLRQRKQSRKPTHDTYFSQTLGISDPAPVSAQAEDENPRLL
jgi:hypothetical protein